MKLYVEMDELQLEKYKESLKKPKELTDFSSFDLAAALLNVIQKENGAVNSTETFDNNSRSNKKTSVAKIKKSSFVISLIIEQLLG